ncbi:MAG: iron-containing alcohol dehydrogenase [Syntrophobacteraceae bacterium]|nr:iron-containing alcohol dehydrogenase [Syntrophobacteraceae bacterium]
MDAYDSLQKFEVPEVIHGLGALSIVGRCARRLGGERILLVTDPGIIEAGWVDKTIGHLKEEDLKYVVYDNVVTNPRDFQVETGAQVYERNRCDVIVAVGGGSAIDTAKGIAILVSNHGRIYDYEGCNLVTQPVPPLVCVPTTAGTGADVTQMAVITDSKRAMKMLIIGRAIMPELALIDPLLLQTESPELIAATGMDTLTHAIEAYVSSLSWTLTDPHAIHAIELASEHLVHAVRYKDIPSLVGMSVACLEAGIAFSNAILGAVHALSHPLGGFYDIHHGLANAVLLPIVMNRNMEYSLEKYARIAKAMGADTEGLTIEAAARCALDKVRKIIEELELPSRLSTLGMNPKDIARLAELAKDDICMTTNPYCYSTEEIESLYREAW